jgi:hypothetical protein
LLTKRLFDAFCDLKVTDSFLKFKKITDENHVSKKNTMERREIEFALLEVSENAIHLATLPFYHLL